jgi:hypothetical protein
MLDPTIRGWIGILAGASITAYAAQRRRPPPARAASLERWGERLLGIALMIQGGATHLDQPRTNSFGEWMMWLALACATVGAVLVLGGRLRRRISAVAAGR